jgi:myo-inositol-hexaphosphate 3-phosphohydrolase
MARRAWRGAGFAACVALGLGGCSAMTGPGQVPTASVAARGETAPVGTSNADAADDPAIWRNLAEPAASLIVGTDKKSGLYVYGLDGSVRHFIDAGAVNNVDLVDGVNMNGERSVLVVASDRNDLARAKLALFRLDTAAARLRPLGKVEAGAGEAYGTCLYSSPNGLYGFSVLKDGNVHQVELQLDGAAPAGRIVRTLKLGSQSEGCAVDGRTGRLYVGEEKVGLWRFDAAPDAPVTPHLVAAIDRKRLVADVEGVAVLPVGDRGGYVIVSSQGDNAFAVFALPDESYVGRFRIGAGRFGSVEETDGIEVMPGDFGPGFPGGLFIAQDGKNAPAAQNFKLVAWQDILDALQIELASQREWLAGDHHIHSEFSAEYTPVPGDPAAMPTPVFGVDAKYPIPRNAEMARHHGLRWMVSTDHGGPGHSRIDHDHAHPALEQSRQTVPQVLQFFGMEFDTPAGDHSSLIIPHGPDERAQLLAIEAGYSRRDAHPEDRSRDTEEHMLAALDLMRSQATPPVLIANHPSRSAPGEGQYGRYSPHEFRNWNDRAPEVAVGMEGAPGHQASALNVDGSLDTTGRRGSYRNTPTRGGFDPMTAIVGGFWDSMLAEGRRWWVTATSDSHEHWRDGGNDFWPGEYSKTWVLARPEHGDILDGLRHGRVFVATGDLVSAVELRVSVAGKPAQPLVLGSTLRVPAGKALELLLRVRDPAGANSNGDEPSLARIDVIRGTITGAASDRNQDRHPGAQVIARLGSGQWQRDGEWISLTHRLDAVQAPFYLRLRGTSTTELEPSPDPAGEDPWSDLWFYTNPVFVEPVVSGSGN